jgi:predicted CXXCH cytochrome family protein
VSLVNSGTSTLTADSCAGCHRAHTAQGEFLLKAPSEEALCLSCHGNGATLATTDVEFGVQYEPALAPPSAVGTRTGVLLGALRDGGFLKARIDSSNPTRLTYVRGWDDGPFNTVAALSERPRVGVLGTSQDVNSAHIDLSPSSGDGIADNHTAWGKGTIGSGAVYTVTCTDCHNPHGNGQYRILKPVPGLEADPIAAPVPVAITNTYANFDTIVTSSQHGLAVGDTVVIAGTSDASLNGTKVVVTVTNGFTFKVANATSWPVGTALTAQNLTVDGSGGTVVRSGKVVTDSSIDPDGNSANGVENPTKNYTVIQVKGYQGNASTFLLYARDVVAARTAGYVDFVANVATSTTGTNVIATTQAHGFGVGDTVTLAGVTGIADGPYTVATIPSTSSFTLTGGTVSASGTGGTVTKRVSGSFGDTSGDYFHRTVPWNPGLNTPACDPLLSPGSDNVANQSACNTSNDAPNGQPATISTGTLAGQIAFNDQISTWCSSCHTRYYSNTNPNPGTTPPSSTLDTIPVGNTDSSNRIFPATYAPTSTQYGSPGYGDQVTFSGMTAAGLNTGTWYVIETGTSAGKSYFKVSASQDGAAFTTGTTTATGTFTRTFQSSAASWWFQRADGTFTFQHQTTTNRACVTCHVAHGSNAAMTGPNSLGVYYPGTTTTSTSSRLLKLDNRGTCQMCHDPTGTVPAGTVNGPAGAANP